MVDACQQSLSLRSLTRSQQEFTLQEAVELIFTVGSDDEDSSDDSNSAYKLQCQH